MNLDWRWINRNLGMIGDLTAQHAVLAVLPVLAALVVSIPLGFLVYRTGKAANVILAVFGVIYSIPSLALFVALPIIIGTQILDPLNIGLALAIYSVALLVRSVVDGLRSVPPAVKQSSTAVGFGWFARLVKVELPLAMPVVFAGLRVVTVSNIALVAVAVIVGGGGLGQLLGTGFNRNFFTPVIVALVITVRHGPRGRRDHPARPTRHPAVGPEAAHRMNYLSYLLDASKWGGDGGTGQLLLQHLAYTAAAVAIGAVIAIPLGILIGHTGRGGFLVIGLSNAARAIPSIGLLVLVVLAHRHGLRADRAGARRPRAAGHPHGHRRGRGRGRARRGLRRPGAWA